MTTDTLTDVLTGREYTAAELDALDGLPLSRELRAEHALKKREVRGRQAIIAGLLTLAARMARQFAEEHDGACCCGDCSPRLRFIPAVWDEQQEAQAQKRNRILAGCAFTAGMTAAAVEGVTADPFACGGETWADDLRALLALEEAQPDIDADA